MCRNRTLSVIVAMVIAATGCGDDDTASPTAATAGTSGVTSTIDDATAGAPAPELEGTSWVVINYTLPSGSLTNVWDDTEVTLRFGVDGTVAGSTGCNEYSGTFEVEGPYDEFEPGLFDANDGQTLRMGPLTVTERGCEDRIMEQESEILGHFRNVGRWLIARGDLLLRTADGSSTLVEAAAEE